MVTILGFSHMSWLIVFCATLHVAFPKEKGMNGTSVENFDCVVRSYTFKNPTMNCTWNAGKNVPPDTQYFMYLAYHKARDNECPHYISNTLGRHIGCYFPDVIASPYRVNITVNGSSIESPIQSYVDDFRIYDKEQFRPPQNITVDYRSPLYYKVQWEPPPNSRKVGSECFEFQIKDERRNTAMTVQEKTYNFPKPAKYILRIRAVGHITCPISKKMNGEWSEPIEFGTDPDRFPTLPLVLVALGTIVIIVLLILICNRNHIWEKLTDPVPGPKVMWQHEKNEEKWVAPVPIAGESVTVVEEMTADSPKV
ncbi:interleukin-5 receptor subunit alpha-like isoform X2 [Pantherophis guttatus]|uniref:Interleukin-5 receptor subunit alpha-like isoform X2 n=1 Tax=Pantherophis guttatus TaxID=94885 RepID=A0A6P9D566_PANGU|nr:interleukin-5 receptor subunit alpha-like isoform X2 [Pantherophis guttatus]